MHTNEWHGNKINLKEFAHHENRYFWHRAVHVLESFEIGSSHVNLYTWEHYEYTSDSDYCVTDSLIDM